MLASDGDADFSVREILPGTLQVIKHSWTSDTKCQEHPHTVTASLFPHLSKRPPRGWHHSLVGAL